MELIAEQIELKNIPLKPHGSHTLYLRKSVIHVLFATEQAVSFSMGPGRKIPLPSFSNYLFFDEHREFEIPVSANQNTQLRVLEIPIKALHRLITKGMDELNFSDASVFDKAQYHKLSANSEQINDCLQEISATANAIMLEAKKYELISHYFSTPDVQSYECPFLNQKENVEKVRKAKALLIEDLQNSPTIKELSKMVGLNEHNLKTGFKEIYSKPIHSFLKHHKMNEARQLLDRREFKVNEIAELMGYTNVSHFIEAFKKKFGLTPKQYELKN